MPEQIQIFKMSFQTCLIHFDLFILLSIAPKSDTKIEIRPTRLESANVCKIH